MVCGTLSGCGAARGYSSAHQSWPDDYCYAALQADAHMFRPRDDGAWGFLHQVGVVGDIPFSILADTAALPVVLTPSFIDAWEAETDAMREQATGRRRVDQTLLAGEP